MSDKRNRLLHGNVVSTLLSLLLPQMGGFLAITVFNFADRYFVSQLDDTLPAGSESLYLSSISLTFPVVFGVGCIAIGVGMAITTLVSRAIGAGDHDLARRITRNGFILVLGITAVITFLGLATIDPLFTLLGAKPEQLPLLREYMNVWYCGAIVMLIPMTGNNALRGSGNTFWPGVIMLTGSVINVILDPLLIFGYWGFPELGIKGAAYATVFARGCTAIMSLSIIFRRKLIALDMPRWHEMVREWKQMVTYAFPAMFTKMLLPLTVAIYNRMAMEFFGKDAVAALIAGTSVEQFATLAVVALGVVMMIFVSQNLSADNPLRVRRALHFSYRFSFIFSVFCYGLLWVIAWPVSKWFNSIEQVQEYTVAFFHIRPLSYPLLGWGFLCQQMFFAIGKPFWSALMEGLRLLVLGVTCAYIGGKFYGFEGMIGGIAIGTSIGSVLSLCVFEYHFRRHPRVARKLYPQHVDAAA